MFSISSATAIRIVKASGFYDLVVTAPFATPWTFAVVHHFFMSLDASWILPGEVPDISVLGVLFANLLGSVVLVWAWLRWRHPTIALGRMDAVARGLFAVWQIYAVVQGASVLLLVFTVMELVFLVGQVLKVRDEQVTINS